MRVTRLELLRSSVIHRISLSAFLLYFLAVMPLKAAELNTRPLESGWQFRILSTTDRSELKQWHPAQVPGVVHTDLLRNKLIPDPFDGDNEFQLQWIGLADWEYQTTFSIDSAALSHEHLDLVFEGLDTYADVYLNDQPIL